MPQRKSGPGPPSQPASPATETSVLRKPWFLALVLVIATFVAYMPATRAGFVWDDQAHVTSNINLRSAGGLWRIWFEPEASQQYYPLQLSSYWLEFHLWGLHPLGYHLVNVLLHTGNAILLWQVLRRLQVPGAWLAAAIFAVHPVEVESVAWVSERKNMLSGMFYLLALLAFFRYRPPAAFTGKDRHPDCRSYLLGLFLFVCALLSKTVACSLPAVMVLLLWWKKGRVEKRDVYALTPLFVIGAALGLTTAWLEKYHVGAAGTDWSLSFVQRCLLAGRALWFYAGKLFWPHPLSFIYPRWEIDAHTWWQYLFPVAAAGVWVTLWLLRRRLGRGPLVAVSAFAVMLFPALGFFDVYPFRYSFVADHYQYLAGIGLIALFVATASNWASSRQLKRDTQCAGSASLLLVLGALTWRQAQIYRNAQTVWRDTLVKNPRCWLAHNNLGNASLQAGNVPDAVRHYELALQFNPGLAEAHNNLGTALIQTGKLQAAIEHYQLAVRINPDLVMARYNLGLASAHAGKLPKAIQQWEQAAQLQPNMTEAQMDLADAFLRTGRTRDAITHYEQVLRFHPNDAEAHRKLAVALIATGNPQPAISHLEHALRINPDLAEAQNNLAWLLATRPETNGGDPIRAVSLAQRACEQTGNRVAGYLDTLAVAYAAAGRFEDAVTTAQKAIELARAAGQPKLAAEIESRLQLYRKGEPYREPLANNP
jgi:protein O-mannosyl-transferase